MAHYLPVLLVSVSTNAIPDDSSLVTLPRGQVDYLSHEWAEEDVWRSWRNMTRQKNEIANGMRLENASWRTWWKQRNKLKTVTPETLNWLKDSDVTWLYGPLHTAVDWTPPPNPNQTRQMLHLRAPPERLACVSDIYSPRSDEETTEPPTHPARPPLLHTKSAPHIPPLPHSLLRRPSPPRIAPPSMVSSSSDPQAPTKRHITFNTFVEQYIAVDSPRRIPLPHTSSSSSSNSTSSGESALSANGGAPGPRAPWDGRTRGLRWTGGDPNEDDDEDDEDGSAAGDWAGESALSSDSDDALEVCLPRSRTNSRSSRSSSRGSGTSGFAFSTGTSKTIAPIAPARLKTTGVGNGWAGGEWVGTRDEGRDVLEPEPPHGALMRSGAAVDLVSSAAAQQQRLASAFEDDSSFEDDEDPDAGEAEGVFTHRSAYFSATAGADDRDGAYDYFAGPDLGVEFAPAPGLGSGVARQRQRALLRDGDGAAREKGEQRHGRRGDPRDRGHAAALAESDAESGNPPPVLSSSPNGVGGTSTSPNNNNNTSSSPNTATAYSPAPPRTPNCSPLLPSPADASSATPPSPPTPPPRPEGGGAQRARRRAAV
ncbi:hypothetical protein B0H13DRAFT_2657797 [Mycena leptocephala]|nr:hypothetical protein B0H13DRAFT_2657797 [Mycena leptocephala]